MLAIGAASIKKTISIPHISSCIPFVFGIKQFTVGILWLSLCHQEVVRYTTIATLLFLLFALVVWTIIILEFIVF